MTRFNDGSGSHVFYLRKARGTESSPVIADDDDNAGIINFEAYDGDEFHSIASIRGAVDGARGNDDMPGRIEFYVAPDGGASPNIKMVLTENGFLGVGTPTPLVMLHVQGSGRFQGGDVTVTGSNINLDSSGMSLLNLDRGSTGDAAEVKILTNGTGRD